jgi:hypothetical protein
MLKQLSQELTVKLVNAESDTENPQSEIILDGQSTGKIVTGSVLEAAVSWQDFYLLLLTSDIPNEEMLDIHLLDKKLNRLDSATLGTIYSTGTFSSLELNAPNGIGFRFIGDTDWVIELLAKPVFRVPFISEPTGVWRRFGFTRHFKVHGNPRPHAPD